jgi:addiction module RelE/StbE family toxin
VRSRRLEYAPRYFRRLEDIRERIAVDNPTAARRIVERIRAAVTRLAVSSALGRPGRVVGTRELVISGTPYIVPYRVKGDIVQIITILHGAQRWPEDLPRMQVTVAPSSFRDGYIGQLEETGRRARAHWADSCRGS